MAAQSDNVFRFTMIIDGERASLGFDPNPEKFLGIEALLVEQHVAGGIRELATRLESGSAGGIDLLLVAFIAAHRENPDLVWGEFIKVAAPFTVQPADDQAAPVPNRSDRRAATRNGGNRQKTATPPTADAPQA